MKTLDVYAELAPSIAGDPQADTAAKIQAVERGGYTNLETDAAKLRQFMRLWKSDDCRLYLYERWGMAVEAHPDPVSLAMQMLHEHMTQPVDTCGACDGEGLKGVTLRGEDTFIACPACGGSGKRSEWGPKDRGVSLAATRTVVSIFVPAQTSKVLTANLSARVDRPAEYDVDQPMQARTILPAGQKIAKPTGPVGSEDEEEDGDE
jgi:hypothetical protein